MTVMLNLVTMTNLKKKLTAQPPLTSTRLTVALYLRISVETHVPRVSYPEIDHVLTVILTKNLEIEPHMLEMVLLTVEERKNFQKITRSHPD